MLSLTGAYGPFIHHCQHNTWQSAPKRQLDGHSTWLLLTLKDGHAQTDDQAHRGFTGPCSLLLTPDTPWQVTLPEMSEWGFIRFDPVFRPLRTVGKKSIPKPWEQSRALCHVDQGLRAATPREVWDIDLPTIIPNKLLSTANECIDYCNVVWWRNGIDRKRAEIRLSSFLLDLVEYTIQHKQGPVWRLTDPEDVERTWLGELTRWCEERIAHKLKVSDLAVHLGITRQQLHRRITKETGKTPSAYLDWIRYERAKIHLRHYSKMPIGKIAHSCGYQSATVFTRRFKAMSGMTPRAWRQQQSN